MKKLICYRCDNETDKLFKCSNYDIITKSWVTLPPVCEKCYYKTTETTIFNTLNTISDWFVANDYRTKNIDWVSINDMFREAPEELTGEELEQWLNY